ncbi:hypothetical protein LQW54_003582 [Pestalotiopsis sp. IQ-011]
MSAPRTKRQFAGAASDPAQRRITSFFNSSPSGGSALPSSEPSVSRNGLGAVDSSVQANLLSVGMRVRKAIPEGYKTGGYCAFSLWDENNNAKTKTVSVSVSTPTKPAYDAAPRGCAAATTPRELLPFCGIHKIGGMDTQKSAADDFAFSLPAAGGDGPLGLLDMDEEAVPGLTLSQESVESNDSVESSRTRKRFFAADDDDEEEETVEHLQDLGNGRRMATPRKARFRGKFGETVGQENVMVVDDFEEASFLDPSLEVDMNDI